MTSKMATICPHCHTIVPARQSCPGCGAGSQAARMKAQPWREVYRLPSYKRNRMARYRLVGGLCEVCCTKLRGPLHPGGVDWECDHVREARLFTDLDAANDIENMSCKCGVCHKAKTRSAR